MVATRNATIVEPASDWLVRTCNASLGLAATAAGTRCGFCRLCRCCPGRTVLATAPGGGVACFALGWRVFLLHPSFLSTVVRALSRPWYRGLRKRRLRMKLKDPVKPLPRALFLSFGYWPRGGHTLTILLPHKTREYLSKGERTCSAD